MKTINSLLIALFTFVSTICFAQTQQQNNLLQGDPDFETGLNGWHAYTSPWVNIELSNSNYKNRFANEHLTHIDDKKSYHGNKSILLNTLKDNRTYLTTTSLLKLASGQYTYSAYIRCDTDTTVQLRITPSKSKGWKFYSSIAENKFTIENEWKLVSLTFSTKNNQTFIPTIDIFGNNKSCNIDSLMLVSGNTANKSYFSPQPILSHIVANTPYRTPMPSLYLTQKNKNLIISFKISVLQSYETNKQYNVNIKLENTAGKIKDIGRIENLNAPKETLATKNFEHSFPDTGIWKVHIYIYENKTIVSKSTTVVATMVPHTGSTDSFFGTHQKLSPLTNIMGFGAIRDMHLLQWVDIQPSKDKWVLPDEKELSEIKYFTDNGGMYLATLVAESPKKNSWTKKDWGKKNFGKIPLWAGDTSDTRSGQSKHVTRKIKNDSLQSYVAGVVNNMPYLDLEVMNEPNHYMSADEYTTLLKTTYTTIKQLSPETLVVGMANPPIWAYLQGGHKAGFYPQPYKWFDEVLQNDGGHYLDAISVHTYDRVNKDTSPEKAYGGNGQASWATGLKSLAEKYTKDKNIPVWVSEKGIASPSWRTSRQMHSTSSKRVDNALKQAEWIVRSQIDMKAKGIEHFFIWNTPWGTAGNQRYYPLEDTNFTFYDTDGLPRPALIAQKVLIENLSYTSHIAGNEPIKGHRYEIFKKDNSYIVVLWTYSEEPSIINCLDIPSESSVTDMYGGQTQYFCNNNESLTIGASPIYINIDASIPIVELTDQLNNLQHKK